MFTIVRLAICLLLFCGLRIGLKHSPVSRKARALPLICASILFLVSVFVPAENLFVTFPTPKAAYQYVNMTVPEVHLVVEGQDCDLVIGQKKQANVYLIVPKTDEGWKLGLGADTKMVKNIVQHNVAISVYQHRSLEEYFVIVHCLSGRPQTVSDTCDSTFAYSEIDRMFYANVRSAATGYRLIVDGVSIPVFE